MERMPFQPALHRAKTAATPSVIAVATTTSDWRQGLPLLTSAYATVRDLQMDDAASLLTMLCTEEVSRFISPPPTTVEGFERFIAWALRERQHGNYACFAVVPGGMSTAVGLFQLRALEPGFSTAEWGFAIGSSFWGTGVFVEAARMVLGFAFDTAGMHRLEARASAGNGRGNGALQKIGAVQEGVLRRAFFRGGAYHDQVLWSILAEDWRVQPLNRGPQVH
jgi:RimJ/RimL family protein N-acetyltransferase